VPTAHDALTLLGSSMASGIGAMAGGPPERIRMPAPADVRIDHAPVTVAYLRVDTVSD
jgi:hypothetical protein